jgi:hypothetical protein
MKRVSESLFEGRTTHFRRFAFQNQGTKNRDFNFSMSGE